MKKPKLVISVQSAIFITFCFLLAWVKFRHEMWFDESQAWLLARDIGSYKELMLHQVRYEGSTGLWHSLLFVLAKSGLPFQSMAFFSYFVSIAGIWIFLKKAPFSLTIKSLFIFSFYIFYQYSVISRSYVLYLPLFFSLASMYEQRFQKPVLFCVLTTLIAHVSVHGAIIATALMGQHGLDIFLMRHRLNAREKRLAVRVTAFLFLNFSFIVWQLFPPADLKFGPPINTDINWIYTVGRDYLISSLTEVKWSSALIMAVFIAIALAGQRFLLMTAMILPQLVLFGMKWASPWHEGVIFMALIFIAWINWKKIVNMRFIPLRPVCTLSLTCLLLLHVYWSAHSSVREIMTPYTGAPAAAAFVKENYVKHDKKIWIGQVLTASLLPYFDDNIFVNMNNGQKPTYIRWSASVRDVDRRMGSLEHFQPDAIVMHRRKSKRSYPLPEPHFDGYRIVAEFPGEHIWKDRIYENANYVVLERDPRGTSIAQSN